MIAVKHSLTGNNVTQSYPTNSTVIIKKYRNVRKTGNSSDIQFLAIIQQQIYPQDKSTNQVLQQSAAR